MRGYKFFRRPLVLLRTSSLRKKVRNRLLVRTGRRGREDGILAEGKEKRVDEYSLENIIAANIEHFSGRK